MRRLRCIAAASAIGSLLILSGCGREERTKAPTAAADTSERGTPEEQPGSQSAADTSPLNAQAWVDDVSVGTQVAADGSIPAGSGGDDFAPGQPVHVAMEVGDAPAGAAIKVIWFGPDDFRLGEEVKRVAAGEKYLSFTLEKTASWQRGDYRAEVWVGDEKVNTQQFNITDKAADAGANRIEADATPRR